jgi:hypothetical protein
LAALIKNEFELDSLLVTGRAASFEITYKGKTIFSKLQVERFPQKDEVLASIKAIVADKTPDVSTVQSGEERD